MKKMKSLVLVLLSLLMLASAFTVVAGASSAYQTYTYSIQGEALYSPDAYSAFKSLGYKEMGMEKNFNTPTDLFTDSDKKVYIADKGNNRIVVLDRYYKFDFEIAEFVNEQGNRDALKSPEGLFVTDEHIWVCDTLNDRLVRFKKDGSFDKIFGKPESQLINNDGYRPRAMAVDQYGRIYVVSQETGKGIIVMDSKGEFVGFIGAQKVTISLWDIIWKRFQTDEQKMLSENYVAPTYNNISISDDGFIYVTIAMDDDYEEAMEADILKRAKSGDNMPVKLLNPAGEEIMRRNGFWPPAGEVDFSSNPNDKYFGVSVVTDVAVGPEKTWTIIDEKRNKLYTYDFNGNLLFAFGDTGTQLGNLTTIQSVVYQGDNLLVLDGTKTNMRLVVFNRTEYGNVLIEALHHQNVREYDLAIESWKEILMRNSNYDAAYVGIGQALFRSGAYEEALDYYKSAYDTENYSAAYKELRKQWMSSFFLLIPVAVVVICLLLGKFLRYAAKINKAAAVSGKKHTFKEELLFVFHLMFHPFDAFWDLKHEKRGSVRASIVFIALTVIAFFYRSVGQGYVMNPQGEYSTIFMQALVVLIPLLLFAVSNWCLTTLFEGEGNFKNIFVAISYSLVPLVLTIIPTTLASNFVVASETDILSLIVTVGFIWAGFLIFFGMMVTHGYNIPKNLVTTLGTIVGMAFIMFLAILFTSLMMDMVTFVTNIVSEITYRI